MMKNIAENGRSRLIVAVLVMFSSVMVQYTLAGSEVLNVAGAWETASNWSLGTVPAAADTVFIRVGREATISSDVGSITSFNLGDNYGAPPYTGTLTINSGKLVVSADGACVGRQAQGAIGTLNLNGGTLQIGDATGSQRLFVGLDTTAKATQGFFNINGGTFIGKMIVGSSSVTGAVPDTLTINGSSAAIGCTSSGTVLDVRETGTIKFIFDSTGVSVMDYGSSGNGRTVTFATGSQIIIDGAAYTGDGTFSLIKAGTLGTAATPTVILTNCVAGSTYSYNTTTDIFSVSLKSPKSLKLISIH